MEQERRIFVTVSFFPKLEEETYVWELGAPFQSVLERNGYHFEITGDLREAGPDQRIRFRLSGKISARTAAGKGVRFGFQFPLETRAEASWRFCVPSMVYTKPMLPGAPKRRTFMEDRLTAPMVLAYDCRTGDYLKCSKEKPYEEIGEALREKGDSRYLQRTGNSSMGYGIGKEGEAYFACAWPYGEEDRSSALSADECPAIAYYPLDGEDFAMELSYCLHRGQTDSFAEAVYEAFEREAVRLEEAGDTVAELPFTMEESRQYRIKSLGESYREFEGGGAGFFFHFDPRYGYGSRPSGFSTCYDTIPHNSYTHILEYGFTGRQINAAYIMASEQGGEWIGRGERVIDFFVDHCQLDNGWLYSLYDLSTGKPFFSFGDPEAPKLHYISRTSKKGNYLRTMTEPMRDLLECCLWYRSLGRVHEKWEQAVLKYADFLAEHQEEDGSWYRAYCPDGEGTDAVDDLDGSREDLQKGRKSATAIPLVFLSELCRYFLKEGERYRLYRQRALRAGEYVLENMVKEEHYQGATMDNPNQVDKEAAQYVMAGLCHLYLLTGEERWLEGAENAAFLFTTWNYVWNAPMKKGTILYEKGFKTKGLGAINSVWGGGVVDIYSLFHIRELYQIGVWRKHPLMCRMAEWIARATAQILSCFADDMGFADIGMQPEGFGICPQGADEGMIQKGGIWGTLGWIYSAGIYGLGNYLHEKEEMKDV